MNKLPAFRAHVHRLASGRWAWQVRRQTQPVAPARVVHVVLAGLASTRSQAHREALDAAFSVEPARSMAA